MRKLEIYTDGSYRATNKSGSYGFIAKSDDAELLFTHEEKDTTNNVMEIKAVIAAIRFINDNGVEDEFDSIDIYSDSAYVVNTINIWWKTWSRNNFRTTSGKVKNLEILQELMTQFQQTKKVSVSWVKGHDNSEMNNRIDKAVQDLTKKP